MRELEQAMQAMAEAQRAIKAAYGKATETHDAARLPLLVQASASLDDAQRSVKRAL